MAKYILNYLKTVAPKWRKQKWLAPVVFSMVVIGLGTIVGLTWNSAAKYFQANGDEAVVKAKEFYFTSDYLTLDGGEPFTVAPNTGGTVAVTFELRNYDGLNKSELDIHYEVSVEPSAEVGITYGTEGNAQGNQIIGVDEGFERVTLSGLKAGVTYTVFATGRNGYEKTLKATFIVDAVDYGIYKNTKNYGDYVLLTIWTEDKGGTVEFTVPSGLIPDATDDMLRGKAVGSEIIVELEEYESRTFRFFTTVDYAGGAINVQNLPETTLN